MNDLDRKIAELKGWTERNHGIWDHPRHGWAEPIVSLNWSTSDSKALELVDEVIQGTPGAGFQIYGGLGKYDRLPCWLASFMFWGPDPMHEAKESAPTRPEAICRAYIAAVTWMREKKG